MPKIFISYRRAETETITGRIYDRLVNDFGAENIFMDISNIKPGADFRAILAKEVQDCDIIVIIIGNQWLSIPDVSGKRRLDNPEDFVRIEVEAGLNRESWSVIPVLVQGAKMPRAEELPDSLKPLSYRNAATINSGPNFHRDMDHLVKAIKANSTGDLLSKIIFFLKEHKFLTAGIIAGILIAIIGISAYSLLENDRGKSSGTPTTEETSATLTPSSTQTDIETLDIAFIVQTLDAEATMQRATENFLATAEARATEYALSTQEIVGATQTSTNWTQTPTPNITASIDAYRTQEAATTTQVWIDSWTATPAITPTPDMKATAEAMWFPNGLGRDANHYVTQNSQWTPVEQTINGIEMVLVPAGCFEMGSNASDAKEDEQPVSDICFTEPYWIGKYEVTNAEFAEFIEANGYTTRDYWTNDGWEWLQEEGVNNPRSWVVDNLNDKQQPVVGVSWYEAIAFVTWKNLELPTEAQWEYAASGVNNLIFPWGNSFVSTRLVHSANQSYYVNINRRGQSWVNAYTMSGNVWEWTRSLYVDYPYIDDERNALEGTNQRVLRGGSWSESTTYEFTTYNRKIGYPYFRLNNRGFRVYSPYNP